MYDGDIILSKNGICVRNQGWGGAKKGGEKMLRIKDFRKDHKNEIEKLADLFALLNEQVFEHISLIEQAEKEKMERKYVCLKYKEWDVKQTCGLIEREILNLLAPTLRKKIYPIKNEDLEELLYVRAYSEALLFMRKEAEHYSSFRNISYRQILEDIAKDMQWNCENMNAVMDTAAKKMKDVFKKQMNASCRHNRKSINMYEHYSEHPDRPNRRGGIFEFERKQYEIELFLSAVSVKTGNKAAIRFWEDLNEYGFKKIIAIPGWENINRKQFAVLQKSFRSLRRYVYGDGKAEKRSIYSYLDNKKFIECIALIYQYVDYYTEYGDRGPALHELNYIYYMDMLDKACTGRDKGIFSSIIVMRGKDRYNAYAIYEDIVSILHTTYSYIQASYQWLEAGEKYIKPTPKKGKGIQGFFWFGYLELKRMQESGKEDDFLGNPFKNVSYEDLAERFSYLSIDYWILYRSIWSRNCFVTQGKFLKTFEDAGKKLEDDYGVLKLSLELRVSDEKCRARIYENLVKNLNDLKMEEVDESEVIRMEWHFIKKIFESTIMGTCETMDWDRMGNAYSETIYNIYKSGDEEKICDRIRKNDQYIKKAKLSVGSKAYSYIMKNIYGPLFGREQGMEQRVYMLTKKYKILLEVPLSELYPYTFAEAKERLKRSESEYKDYLRYKQHYHKNSVIPMF